MTDIEAIDILKGLVTKLEDEMRFAEREAVEIALGYMVKLRHPSSVDLNQQILDIAIWQSDLYKKGLM
jgi:hypothetical protein